MAKMFHVLFFFLIKVQISCASEQRSLTTLSSETNVVINKTSESMTETSLPGPDDDLEFLGLAGHKVQFIAQNLLAFDLKDLAEELTALGPAEYRKSLKPGCNWNLLHEAVYTDLEDVAEFLVVHFKFDPNQFDPYFGNCVYLVGSVKMVQTLLKVGTDFNIARTCHKYESPAASALSRNSAAYFSYRDGLFRGAFDQRVHVFINGIRSQQSSSPIKEFIAPSKEKMYAQALKIVSQFTTARNPNANIKITYRDQYGVDMGGLTVDFISYIKNELIAGGVLFETDGETGLLNLKSDAPIGEAKLAGFIVGLSIYHKVPLNLVFSPIIYHLICAQNLHRDINFVSVLAETDATVMAGFRNLRKISDQSDELREVEFIPQTQGDTLRPWKRRKTVVRSREDLAEYIKSSSKHLVYGGRASVYDSFLNGLGHAIDFSSIGAKLTPSDLVKIIKGTVGYTSADLKANSVLTNPGAFSNQYNWFFEIVDELTPEQRAKLLKFFTSLECLPVSGFKDLSQKITLEVLTYNRPDEKLPGAATCFNTLKLHCYSSKAIMKERLIKAIEECVGFHLA